LTNHFVKLTLLTQITIQVIDVNDEIPVFDPPGGPFEIDENSADGTVIATVRATDNDFSGKFRRSLLSKT